MDIDILLSHSYAPYSGNTSVALLKSREKRYFPGVRVENVSYPLTISAIQNAIFSCLSEGDQPEVVYLTETNDPQLSFWKNEYNIRVENVDQLSVAEINFFDPILSDNIEAHVFLPAHLSYAVTIQSNFPVAALLKTDKGLFSGVNIECSSWNMGLCAERVAIAKAIAYGSKEFHTMHIHTRDGEFSSPCGACRQVIMEHLPKGRIHLHHADHSESSYFSSDLLPYSFRSTKLIKKKK